jgi:hypothetical protein
VVALAEILTKRWLLWLKFFKEVVAMAVILSKKWSLWLKFG